FLELSYAALADRFQIVPDIADEPAQVDVLALELDGRRVATHLVEEVAQVVLGLLNVAGQSEQVRAVARPELQQVEAGLGALKSVAALVGQTGHHFADGGQALGVPQLLFRLLAGRDIARDLDEATKAAGLIEERRDDYVGPEARAVAPQPPTFILPAPVAHG